MEAYSKTREDQRDACEGRPWFLIRSIYRLLGWKTKRSQYTLNLEAIHQNLVVEITEIFQPRIQLEVLDSGLALPPLRDRE